MKCKDIMSKNLKMCRSTCSASDAAQIMKEINSGVVPVVDENNHIVGILTDRDITLNTAALYKDPSKTKVQDIMSKSVITVHPNDNIDKAIAKMKRNRVRRIPVVDENKSVVGIISLGDVAILKQERRETSEALEKISEPTLSSK